MPEENISEGDKMYRYDRRVYASPLDEYDQPTGGGMVAVEESIYIVVRMTPKGCWVIEDHNIGSIMISWKEARRFVLTASRKRFVYPNKKGAMESFIKRSEAHLRILNENIRQINRGIDLIERKMKKDDI